MSETNVRVVFSGNAAGAVRASDQTADSIKRVGKEAVKSAAEASAAAAKQDRKSTRLNSSH